MKSTAYRSIGWGAILLLMLLAIYSSLEVGISAHSDRAQECKLWVDDTMVTDHPFFVEPRKDV
jgi:hypothetical protein